MDEEEEEDERLALIKQQLQAISDKPGVYRIFNADDELIYVGKAKDLKNRLRSHFAPSTDFSKSRMIREQGVRIEVTEVATEKEAFLFEYNLIQEHQPVLNARWKDGKTYPYLEITTGEEFPRFRTTRERDNKDSVYLGPYSDLTALKKSLKYAFTMFPVADCKKEIHLGDSKTWAHTCIRRRTKQCFRPCEVEVDVEEYKENVDKVIQFIEGKAPEIAESVEVNMKTAADNLEFEQAAKYRDILKNINRTIERQRIMIDGVEDIIIIADAKNNSEISVALQKIENERIIRQDATAIAIKDLDVDDYPDFVVNFVMTIFGSLEEGSISHKAILDTNASKEIIAQLKSLGMEITSPENDIHKHLVKMTNNNAKRYLQRRVLFKMQKGLPSSEVEDLQEILSMDMPPFIIDTFDVSTLFGTNNVASCVRFRNGKPLKKGYRRFEIKTVHQQDDFASMEEAVFRRYRDFKDGVDPKGLEIPQLVVIDGGPEQLKRAHIALTKLKLDILTVGLAKREEEIYRIDEEKPIQENKTRPGMLLIRAGRDEAHRFAVKYQRKLRQTRGLRSILDSVDGIGQKRKERLQKKYRTISNIAKESSETISEGIGISQELASRVIDACRKFLSQADKNSQI